MARYIDSDEFEKYINREEWKTPDEKWWPERELGMLLDAIPTADVVEVVRCKDCVYWEQETERRGNCNRALEITAYASDFCSYGKRREKEELDESL